MPEFTEKKIKSPMYLDSSKYIYRLQEAFVYTVLVQIYGSERVLWNPVPSPVELDADFVVTKVDSSPESVFCITHQSSQNAHQAKAWRDMHELFLYRSKLPEIKTVRILFGKETARGWHHILERFFDFNFVTGDYSISIIIDNLINSLIEKHGLDNSNRFWVDVINTLSDQTPVLKFAGILKKGMTQEADHKLLAELSRRGHYNKLFLPSVLRRAVAFSGITGITEPEKFNPAGRKPFVEKTVFGNRIEPQYREWIESSISYTDCKLFKYITSRGYEEMTVYRKRSTNIKCFIDTAEKSIRLFKNNDWTGLEKLHYDGFKLVDKCGGNPLWLGLRYYLRSTRGDSYGSSWLCKEAGIHTGVANLFSISKIFTGESDDFPTEVFSVLVKTVVESVKYPPCGSEIFRIILFEEAIKSRHLEPLFWIIEKFCNFQGQLSTVATVIDPGGKTGTIRGYVFKEMFFYWKTAFDGHRDKTKEMAGRGMALALSENPFIRRVLLLDGSFTGRDIETLARSGWTDIFSVSDLDSLRCFIGEFH
ncbi:hypothetical protein KKF34_13820 [Myxococcota bacterium]|nr:hypothetical protein [Myxococcota bacterium]MBU1382489.1 hypothetical protein [Myxococcota bacterium]MBU1497949.1 hypothetical protein [Myxococcota bacterium]